MKKLIILVTISQPIIELNSKILDKIADFFEQVLPNIEQKLARKKNLILMTV